MRQKTILVHILFILSLSAGFSQSADEKILMTVAGMDVEAGEFIRMFNKSPDPAYRVEIGEYLQQFIAFKLKVADAIEHGYDTTLAFRDELNGYRQQLAQTWLTEPDIKDKVLRKAYERYLEEINASHILINCKPDASPEDTLRAYEKAVALRNRILEGEPFAEVAKAGSDDRSVNVNNGNLGYFTVFQMITPFEDAVYSLQPGTVSEPVRTPFGYHIIKVNDRRPSRGKVRVAHIMKSVPPGSEEQTVIKAQNEIDELYERLGNGESFAKLASEKSDHRESAVNGGEMNWFGTGEIISDFSEAAFAIKDTGEYTRPVRSPYGFHIIKLLEKKSPGTLEEAKPFLESRLNQSELVEMGKRSFIDRLRNEYGFTVNPAVRNWFVKNTDTLIIRGKAKYPVKRIPKGNIYSFAGQGLNAAGFASYLENGFSNSLTHNAVQFIDAAIETISSGEIMKYEDSILEKKHPDFKYLMKEFHDGILLFEISSDKVWNRAQTDTSGLMLHYEKNKDKFMSERSIGSSPLPFSEVQADVISSYQDWLNEEWIAELKKRYDVRINEKVFEEVIKRLANE